MKNRAINEKDRKLSLHTLLSYNLRLKADIFNYIQARPETYVVCEDLLVKGEDCTSFGYMGGFFETFGIV